MKDLAIAYAMKKKAQKFAEGGTVESEAKPMEHEDGDIVERIMKSRMSKVTADEMPNDFDVLDLEAPEEVRYDGDNSGDHVGNSQLESDEDDIIARIMKSESMKDRLPKVR